MDFNNGSLSSMFFMDSPFMKGTVSRKKQNISEMTARRMHAERMICDIAEAEGSNKEKVVGTILGNSKAILQSYVRFKGVNPLENEIALAAQAAILRAADVAYISEAADTTDIDALLLLENSEQEAYELANPDSDYILPPDIQAALKISIEKLQDLHRENGGTGFLRDLMSDIKKHKGADGFDFDPSIIVVDTIMQEPGYNRWYGSDLTVQQYNQYPDNFTGRNGFDGYNSADGSGTTLFDFLDTIFKGGLSGTIQDVVEQMKGGAADLASYSLKEAIIDNLPLIIGIFLLLGLTIYFSIRAAKNK